MPSSACAEPASWIRLVIASDKKRGGNGQDAG
jgi:hypothetical protein